MRSFVTRNFEPAAGEKWEANMGNGCGKITKTGNRKQIPKTKIPEANAGNKYGK